MNNYMKSFILFSLLSVSCYFAYDKLADLRYQAVNHDADICKRFIEYYLQETTRNFYNENCLISGYDDKRCKSYVETVLGDRKELVDYSISDSRTGKLIAGRKNGSLVSQKLRRTEYKPYCNLAVSDIFYDESYKTEVLCINSRIYNISAKKYLDSTIAVSANSLIRFLRKAKLRNSHYICVKQGEKTMFHIGRAREGKIKSSAIVNGVNWVVICK